MKICRVYDHQNKSAAYKQALAEAGYTFTERSSVQGCRFFLSDADWREIMMEEAAARSVPVFLYPHAARPMVQYDCPNLDPHPVRCMFTHAEGGVELMKRIGYPYPVEAVGWSYSEIRPFQPVKEVRRILFAPIHPNANGYLSDIDIELNRRTYKALSGVCSREGIELSIRYIGYPVACGLADAMAEALPFVEWHRGKKNNSTADMDSADVIVAHQTYAYLAVALGKPTLMFGEDVPPRSGNTAESFCYVQHWKDYEEYLRFPLDILAGDPDSAIADACTGTDAVEDWKRRFIGEPFDGERFVKTLEGYL